MSFDQLHRYIFKQTHVRGELVRLEQSYQAILHSYHYPPVLQRLLGELMAGASLLSATLKFEGEIALQLQSDGPVKYAVINGTHDQKLRGVARWDESQELPDDFPSLFENGVLVITITPTEGKRYQGMVALDQDSLAQCIECYFQQSEQLATKVILRSQQNTSGAKACGLFLQVLPTGSAATVTSDTGFEHLAKLTETIKDEELFTLEVEDILYRLYHQEDVEIFPPTTVAFKCSCSRQRSANAIAAVDKQELLDIVAKEGAIKMNCQYCHTEYRFDSIDVEAIHGGTFTGEPGPTQ